MHICIYIQDQLQNLKPSHSLQASHEDPQVRCVMYVYVCIRMSVYEYVCMYVYVCMCMYMYVYIFIHVHVHACLHVCM